MLSVLPSNIKFNPFRARREVLLSPGLSRGRERLSYFPGSCNEEGVDTRFPLSPEWLRVRFFYFLCQHWLACASGSSMNFWPYSIHVLSLVPNSPSFWSLAQRSSFSKITYWIKKSLQQLRRASVLSVLHMSKFRLRMVKELTPGQELAFIKYNPIILQFPPPTENWERYYRS